MTKAVIWWVAVVLLMASSSLASAATTHEVGGRVGWTMPEDSETYTNWAAGQTFRVGDSLRFTFPTELSHSVMEVSKSDYDSCTTTAPIGDEKFTGPASLNLSTAGMHYYICGYPTHCSFDMKLSFGVGRVYLWNLEGEKYEGKNEFADDSSKSLEHQKLGPSPTSRINQTIPSHERTDERLSYQK
ncbi:hypothetical protein QJS04_geneDACA005646 [Acorus gramineus]|uniref:Phytocyanin domain-containing protein n=1 Tax=Acorus gramineus TaxID=55184 RepID=A0AAV9A566_ACOGR|nr:hypothetical protein QJS04_geneDACA005646 [Acorus gramineus]